MSSPRPMYVQSPLHGRELPSRSCHSFISLETILHHLFNPIDGTCDDTPPTGLASLLSPVCPLYPRESSSLPPPTRRLSLAPSEMPDSLLVQGGDMLPRASPTTAGDVKYVANAPDLDSPTARILPIA